MVDSRIGTTLKNGVNQAPDKENIMKDIDLFNEYINRMMLAAENASKTSRKLRNNPEAKHFDKLNAHLQEITDHLKTLQDYLNHQGDYSLEELADWVSTATTGKHTEHRHSSDWKH